jgi:hypothetical protein
MQFCPKPLREFRHQLFRTVATPVRGYSFRRSVSLPNGVTGQAAIGGGRRGMATPIDSNGLPSEFENTFLQVQVRSTPPRPASCRRHWHRVALAQLAHFKMDPGLRRQSQRMRLHQRRFVFDGYPPPARKLTAQAVRSRWLYHRLDDSPGRRGGAGRQRLLVGGTDGFPRDSTAGSGVTSQQCLASVARCALADRWTR